MRKPIPPPPYDQLVQQTLNAGSQFFLKASEPIVRRQIDLANDQGWNWEQCGYRTPEGLTKDEFWLLVKLSRSVERVVIPLKDAAGKNFSYRLPPAAHRILHRIDTHLGGAVQTSLPQLDTEAQRTRYLVTSLTEEAIASSQIEGAVVTREQAKEMLRSKRQPRSIDERMILNNYQTIRMLNDKRSERLTVDLLFDIQRCLTDGTWDKADAGGRFRRPDERITVWDEEDHEPLHVPPPAGELPGRIEALCRFANGDGADGPGGFVHPAVRAVVLHFWVGYDHPFVDGNGRTARALFYWSMLRSGYWLVEYLTISAIIRGHPKQYARAYLDTETDGNDLTYFILYHLGVVERSVAAFREYLDKKLAERSRQAAVLAAARFNGRQQALLGRALKRQDARFTYESHAGSHGVSVPTARADLLDLEKAGLLVANRKGRRFEFVPAPDLDDRLRKLAAKK